MKRILAFSDYNIESHYTVKRIRDNAALGLKDMTIHGIDKLQYQITSEIRFQNFTWEVSRPWLWQDPRLEFMR